MHSPCTFHHLLGTQNIGLKELVLLEIIQDLIWFSAYTFKNLFCLNLTSLEKAWQLKCAAHLNVIAIKESYGRYFLRLPEVLGAE